MMLLTETFSTPEIASSIPFLLPTEANDALAGLPSEVIEQAIALDQRLRCERSHLDFTRFFFKHRQGTKFRVNWHHHVVAQALGKVLRGETQNLVINVPPGSSKTEMAVINFIARGMALNSNARFLHISSGDELVLLNSQTAREIVQSEEFQAFWPMKIADDAKAKKRWNVIIDNPDKPGKLRKAGGVYAVALGGQITGFRAGHMSEGFQGAIIIDDPLKADDAYSEAEIKKANRRLLSTVKSRKASPNTPIIVIMQRLGEKDPTGFIRGGNLPGKWEFITIPSLIDVAYIKQFSEKIQAMIRADTDASPRDDKGRFSYWEFKEPLAELLELEAGGGTDADGSRVSRYTFASQYQQEPKALGGNVIHGDKFIRSAMAPKIMYRKVYGDTAMKTGERNDYSVFECWGYGEDRKIYLLDLIRGKWEAPELERRAIEFWQKHASRELFPDAQWGACRQMPIEDKASGTGLIQGLRTKHGIPVRAIERNKDKLTRVMDVLPFIDAGFVCLLEGKPFNSDFIAECESFAADDSHAHDDQVDPMCDAISDMLGPKPRGFFDVSTG